VHRRAASQAAVFCATQTVPSARLRIGPHTPLLQVPDVLHGSLVDAHTVPFATNRAVHVPPMHTLLFVHGPLAAAHTVPSGAVVVPLQTPPVHVPLR
jgi:hypothetical protein